MTGACRPTPLEEIIAKALLDAEDKITHSRAFNELHTERGDAYIRAMAMMDALLAAGTIEDSRHWPWTHTPPTKRVLVVPLVADEDTT